MYYVYILKSLSNNFTYVGYTTDLKKRFDYHQNGYVKSTKAYKPFELIFYEAYKAMADAKRREKYLKTDKGKSTLRMMLRESLR
ncbi:MAG: GIY-YIG nuclease family protein [Patescibacteria group bacterium]